MLYEGMMKGKRKASSNESIEYLLNKLKQEQPITKIQRTQPILKILLEPFELL